MVLNRQGIGRRTYKRGEVELTGSGSFGRLMMILRISVTTWKKRRYIYLVRQTRRERWMTSRKGIESNEAVERRRTNCVL